MSPQLISEKELLEKARNLFEKSELSCQELEELSDISKELNRREEINEENTDTSYFS